MKCTVYTATRRMRTTNVAEAWQAPQVHSAMDVACFAFLVLWKCGRLDRELGGA